MGGIVDSIGSVVGGVVNAVSSVVQGVGGLLGGGGGSSSTPAAPPPPSVQPLPEVPTSAPTADWIKQRQQDIQRKEQLKRVGVKQANPSTNILTGAQGDTSLNQQGKTLLGS